MTYLESLSRKIRDDEPIPWYLDTLLTAATPLYRTGMLLRGMQTPVKVDARVISFGNLTAGGTGKTPAVIERAEAEIAAGNRVAILTRGYGATKHRDITVLMQGEQAFGMADWLGDEPVMIARRVPEVVVARRSNRVDAARASVQMRNCNVLILDDGFQYLRLARDENVLVVDAVNPFGNGHLLPRGILREPVASAVRATAIILTHCDRVTSEDRKKVEAQLREFCPDVPIRATRHAPDTLWSLKDSDTLPLDSLQGRPVVAVCAIGCPEHFAATLKSLGAEIVEERFFTDHAQIPDDALRSEHLIVTTEKDAARIVRAPANVYALGIRLADWKD